MTDAEYEQTKARLQAIADEWAECLGLASCWHITWHYHRDSGEYAAVESGRENNRPQGVPSVAYTAASWHYLLAAIHFNVSELVEYDNKHLEMVVLHELAHVFVHEMRYVTDCDCEKFNIRHEERVCTTLQWAFVWTKEHFRTAASEVTPSIETEDASPNAG